MERLIKLIPYRVYKYCPKCTGTMEVCNWGSVAMSSGTGMTWVNTPVVSSSVLTVTSSFNHKCNKCGYGDNYDKNYPYIDYIEDGDLG